MKRLNYFGGILIGLLIVFAIIFILTKRNQLRNEGRYTIGVTNGQNGKFIKYSFKVRGQEYLNENQILKHSPLVSGGRYFVKYLPNDLSVSEIYLDKPVPAYIEAVPPDGWKEIP